MITTPTTTNASQSSPAGGDPLVDQTRREIQRLAQDIARLARSQVPAPRFRSEYLARLAAATGGVAAAWWEQTGGGWRLVTGYHLPAAGVLTTADEAAAWSHDLNSSADWQAARYRPPRQAEASAAPSCEWGILQAGCQGGPQTRVVIQVFRRPIDNRAAERGYLDFLGRMVAEASEYLQRETGREPAADGRKGADFWQALDGALRRLHAASGLEQRARVLADMARQGLGCRRVSIAWRRAGQLEIVAVSGVAQIDARSEDVQRLRKLARTVAESGHPVAGGLDRMSLPAAVRSALEPYLQDEQPQPLVLPLVSELPETGSAASGGKRVGWPGVMICEGAKAAAAPDFAARAAALCAHGMLALNSATAPSVPVAEARGGRWWLTAALIVLPAVAALLALYPARLQIAAPGKLLPTVRREVFAHVDGTVARVHAQHAQLVEPGEVLAEMESTDLAVAISEVVGQRDKALEQLQAREQLFVQNQHLSPAVEQQLAGEILELKQAIRNCQQRLELYAAKHEKLTIRSPIRGQVVTWNVEDQLLRRPVRSGQVLLSVVDPQGPWELELYVPERRVGHVLQAMEASDEPVEVCFQLHAQSGREFRGTILDYHRLAEVRPEQGNTVAVRVAVNKEDIAQLHPETTVSAQIQCGRRSLGYVLFQDVIETAQRAWLYCF